MSANVTVVPAGKARAAQEKARADYLERFRRFTGGRLDPDLADHWWPLTVPPMRRWRDPYGTVADLNTWVKGSVHE